MNNNNQSKKQPARTEYTARQFIQEVVINGIGEIVENYPYYAFSLLAEAIEVLGKCLNDNPDWYQAGCSESDFLAAINNLEGLSDYRRFYYVRPGNSRNGSVPTNYMYTDLRCGLLHSALPKQGIRLSPDENDLERDIVGCRALYGAIKNAWEEINSGRVQSGKNLDGPLVFYVDDSITGSTETNIYV